MINSVQEKSKKPQIRAIYETQTRDFLMKKMGYSNVHAVPNIKKVVINMGLGRRMQEKNIFEAAMEGVADISGQKPCVTKAKKIYCRF